MSTKLAVDGSHELREYRDHIDRPQQPAVRVVGQVLSYVFHPLFVPVYLAIFLFKAQSYLFFSLSPVEKLTFPLRFFLMYSFFPLVTVLLAKALGFLDSVYLKTQKDRVIPYITSAIYYFWMSYVLRHQPEFPKELVQLTMAIFLASSLGLIANIYLKISMHAIAMGILVFFVGMLAMTQHVNYAFYFSIALLLAGLVCTARLIVSDHTPAEIYWGLLLGLVSHLLAIGADRILP